MGAGNVQRALNEIGLIVIPVIVTCQYVKDVAIPNVEFSDHLAVNPKAVHLACQAPPILACGHSSNDACNLIIVDHFL